MKLSNALSSSIIVIVFTFDTIIRKNKSSIKNWIIIRRDKKISKGKNKRCKNSANYQVHCKKITCRCTFEETASSSSTWIWNSKPPSTYKNTIFSHCPSELSTFKGKGSFNLLPKFKLLTNSPDKTCSKTSLSSRKQSFMCTSPPTFASIKKYL